MGYLCHFSSFLIENIFQIQLKIQDLRFYVSSDVQPNMPETRPFFISPNSCTEQLFSSVYRDSIFPGLFQFSSPGTFGLDKSRNFLAPGPSGSQDLLSQDFLGHIGTKSLSFFAHYCILFQSFFVVAFLTIFFLLRRANKKKDLQGKNITFLR